MTDDIFETLEDFHGQDAEGEDGHKLRREEGEQGHKEIQETAKELRELVEDGEDGLDNCFQPLHPPPNPFSQIALRLRTVPALFFARLGKVFEKRGNQR